MLVFSLWSTDNLLSTPQIGSRFLGRPSRSLSHFTDSAVMYPNPLYMPLYSTVLNMLPLQPVDA
jgi:hypothetical protein